jgi:hypothetical protein
VLTSASVMIKVKKNKIEIYLECSLLFNYVQRNKYIYEYKNKIYNEYELKYLTHASPSFATGKLLRQGQVEPLMTYVQIFSLGGIFPTNGTIQKEIYI